MPKKEIDLSMHGAHLHVCRGALSNGFLDEVAVTVARRFVCPQGRFLEYWKGGAGTGNNADVVCNVVGPHCAVPLAPIKPNSALQCDKFCIYHVGTCPRSTGLKGTF